MGGLVERERSSGTQVLASVAKRRARQMRAVALLAALLVVVVGSLLMWQLYGSLFATSTDPGTPSSERSPTALVVGIGRTPGGAGEWATYTAVFAELERRLGRPIILRWAISHPDIEDLVARGEVDIALVPIYVYLNLEARGTASLVAAPELHGSSHDAAVLVVARSSAAHRLEDLRGGTIAMTQRSIAGRPFADWLLEQRGETSAEFFGAINENDAQDLDLGQVLSGEADAACVSRDALVSWPGSLFRVLEESPSFGMPPLVARAGLDEELIEKVREGLVTMELGHVARDGSALSGFQDVAAKDYDFPRERAQMATASANPEAVTP